MGRFTAKVPTDEEQRAEAEAVEGHRGRAQRDVARRGNPAEQAEEERADARRRDEAAHEAEQERAAVARAADARQAVVEARRERELEGAEERRGQRDEDERDRADDPGVAERRAEALARHRGDDAHRREEAHDAEDEREREERALPAALGLLGAEDRDRDGDHRVDARREAGGEAADVAGRQGDEGSLGEVALERSGVGAAAVVRERRDGPRGRGPGRRGTQ